MKRGYWYLSFLILMIISFVFDRELLNSVQNLRFPVLDLIMQGFSSLVLFVIIVIFFSYLLWDKKKIIYLWAGAGFAYVVSLILKQLIRIPRPLGSIEAGFGFPSSHATVYFFLAMFMGDRFEKYKGWFVLLAVAIMVSRVYLGDHRISEVIGGGLLGGGLYLLYKKWLKV